MTAFVGTGAAHNDVTVTRGTERLICQTCLRKQLHVIAACFALGLGFLVLRHMYPSAFRAVHSISRHLEISIVLALLGCGALLAYNFARRQRFELMRQSGELLFYKGGAGPACMRLQKQEIASFDVSKRQASAAPASSVRGYILSAKCSDGRIVGLCSSSDRELLRSLRADLENSMLRK